MRDSMTLQLQNGQQLFALLQSRLERVTCRTSYPYALLPSSIWCPCQFLSIFWLAMSVSMLASMQAIRRGTWLAVQLQAVWVLLLVLASVLANHFLSQQPHSFLKSLVQAAVPVLTTMCALSALTWQPWQLPPAKKLPEATPAATKTATPADGASQEAEGPSRRMVDMGVDATGEGRHKAEEEQQLAALSKVCSVARECSTTGLVYVVQDSWFVVGFNGTQD